MKKTNIQTIAIITFIVILIAVAGYLIYKKNIKEATLATYTNTTYGISFDYPDSYRLDETPITEGETGTMVTLTDKGISIPTNGEGPTAITIAMYDAAGVTTSTSTLKQKAKQNPMDAWITTSPYSNFTLSTLPAPGTTTLAGKDARLYTWDGLYQGTTLVTIANNHLFMLSVTYEGNTDMKKREDFTDLVASVRFIESE
jgi:hypothetical protein